jgi:hypothetical protein
MRSSHVVLEQILYTTAREDFIKIFESSEAICKYENKT